MAVIQKLKDYFTGNYIYPHTVTQAVWDEKGNRLDNILKAGLSMDDDDQEDSFEPNVVVRDADTLGGKYSANDIDKAVTFDPDGEEEEIEDVVEVDADLFDGHTSDYYAKSAELMELIQRKTQTVSFDSSGVCELGMTTSEYNVLNVFDNAGVRYIPYVYQGAWKASGMYISDGYIKPYTVDASRSVTIIYTKV